PPASKVLSQWIVATGAPVIQVGGPGVIDPDRNVSIHASLADAMTLPPCDDVAWTTGRRDANPRAEAAHQSTLSGAPLSEPSVARTVAAALPADAELVVAASMPMRDLEWYGGPAARAHANRGANGIDGVVSTALGVALAGRPTVALVGDIAF